jgi:hypothetical protein
MESLHNVVEHEYYYPSPSRPAYNEESAIVQTVRKPAAAGVQALRIVVIDDGSRDNTNLVHARRFPLAPETARPVRYQVNLPLPSTRSTPAAGRGAKNLISRKTAAARPTRRKRRDQRGGVSLYHQHGRQ